MNTTIVVVGAILSGLASLGAIAVTVELLHQKQKQDVKEEQQSVKRLTLHRYDAFVPSARE
jgi:putative effector of murein hydrolase LrgA (UPF0299 family)